MFKETTISQITYLRDPGRKLVLKTLPLLRRKRSNVTTSRGPFPTEPPLTSRRAESHTQKPPVLQSGKDRRLDPHLETRPVAHLLFFVPGLELPRRSYYHLCLVRVCLSLPDTCTRSCQDLRDSVSHDPFERSPLLSTHPAPSISLPHPSSSFYLFCRSTRETLTVSLLTKTYCGDGSYSSSPTFLHRHRDLSPSPKDKT